MNQRTTVTVQLLVVEDDTAVGSALTRALEGQGYGVRWATTGAEALAPDATVPDLVLLDLGLPDLDGVEVCRRLRAAFPECVIVILTARSDEVDIVLGLDAGADDYLSKPFRLGELFARIRAQIRRLQPVGAAAEVSTGPVRVDVAARRVWVGDNEVALRTKEFDLLALLVAEAGAALDRDRIMHDVWDEHWFGSTKTLDMHISSLRRKLADAGGDGAWITTLRGVGYRFERLDVPTG